VIEIEGIGNYTKDVPYTNQPGFLDILSCRAAIPSLLIIRKRV